MFYSIQYKNGCLAASDLFHMFTQSVKFRVILFPGPQPSASFTFLRPPAKITFLRSLTMELLFHPPSIKNYFFMALVTTTVSHFLFCSFKQNSAYKLFLTLHKPINCSVNRLAFESIRFWRNNVKQKVFI